MSLVERQSATSLLSSAFAVRLTSRNEHMVVITIMAFSLVVASISRIPLLEQLPEVKIGIFSAELLSALLLFLALKRRSVAIPYLVFAALFIALRFAFGSIVASIAFEQSIGLSAQESRFGFMLIICPVTYYFLKESSIAQLRRLVSCYMVGLLFLDILIYFVFQVDEVLILGQRTDSRFFISILAPLVTTVVLLLRQHMIGDPKQGYALVMTLGMLLHSLLVTTSRAETLLAAGLLGVILYRRWVLVRFALNPMAIVVFIIISLTLTNADEGVAGRDFYLVIDLAWKALPFGFGAVIDPVAKTALGLPESFFFSDYGLLLYVLRYGSFGVIIVLLLLLLWVLFEFRVRHLKGHFLLALPVLIYLMLIPLLDYGSLTGGFLLALMWLVSRQNLRKNFIR